MPDDRQKARRRRVQHPGRTTAARHGGRGKGKGHGCAPWGNIRGKDRSRVEGRQARRGEKVRRGVVVGAQLLARAYIYSSYI